MSPSATDQIDTTSIEKAALSLYNNDALNFVPHSQYLNVLTQPNTHTQLLLHHFILNFEWHGINVIQALRQLCLKIPLKGESQQINRLLDEFSRVWFESNPMTIFKTFDNVYAVSYACLLLNTEQHGIEKKYRTMTLESFIENTMEILETDMNKIEQSRCRKCLEDLFNDIVNEELPYLKDENEQKSPSPKKKDHKFHNKSKSQNTLIRITSSDPININNDSLISAPILHHSGSKSRSEEIIVSSATSLSHSVPNLREIQSTNHSETEDDLLFDERVLHKKHSRLSEFDDDSLKSLTIKGNGRDFVYTKSQFTPPKQLIIAKNESRSRRRSESLKNDMIYQHLPLHPRSGSIASLSAYNNNNNNNNYVPPHSHHSNHSHSHTHSHSHSHNNIRTKGINYNDKYLNPNVSSLKNRATDSSFSFSSTSSNRDFIINSSITTDLNETFQNDDDDTLLQPSIDFSNSVTFDDISNHVPWGMQALVDYIELKDETLINSNSNSNSNDDSNDISVLSGNTSSKPSTFERRRQRKISSIYIPLSRSDSNSAPSSPKSPTWKPSGLSHGYSRSSIEVSSIYNDNSIANSIQQSASLNVKKTRNASITSLSSKSKLKSKYSRSNQWNKVFAVVETNSLYLYKFKKDDSNGRSKNRNMAIGSGNWKSKVSIIKEYSLSNSYAQLMNGTNKPFSFKSGNENNNGDNTIWSLMVLDNSNNYNIDTDYDGKQIFKTLMFHTGTIELAKEFVLSCNYWAGRMIIPPKSDIFSNVEYGWGPILKKLTTNSSPASSSLHLQTNSFSNNNNDDDTNSLNSLEVDVNLEGYYDRLTESELLEIRNKTAKLTNIMDWDVPSSNAVIIPSSSPVASFSPSLKNNLIPMRSGSVRVTHKKGEPTKIENLKGQFQTSRTTSILPIIPSHNTTISSILTRDFKQREMLKQYLKNLKLIIIQHQSYLKIIKKIYYPANSNFKKVYKNWNKKNLWLLNLLNRFNNYVVSIDSGVLKIEEIWEIEQKQIKEKQIKLRNRILLERKEKLLQRKLIKSMMDENDIHNQNYNDLSYVNIKDDINIINNDTYDSDRSTADLLLSEKDTKIWWTNKPKTSPNAKRFGFMSDNENKNYQILKHVS